MKRLATLITTLFTLCFSTAANAELSGRDIMQKVKDRNDGDNVVMDMDMILIDSKGNKRERTIRSFRRDAPGTKNDTQSIMFFLSPANVENTGFLTYDFDDGDKDDDQWLYLPELKKVKRIASADKSGSFMGTDFTYADMSSPDLDDYDYKLMKEVEINGKKAWQVLSTPNNEAEIERTGYTKSVVFVQQDNFVVVRSVNWVKKGSKNKFMEVKKLEEIDGIWTPTEVIMTTKKGKETEHASVLKSRNVQYNQDLGDDLFTQRRLSNGL